MVFIKQRSPDSSGFVGSMLGTIGMAVCSDRYSYSFSPFQVSADCKVA